jgi:hypothetical protein
VIRHDLMLPLIKVFLLAFAGLLALAIAEKRWKLLSTFRAETSSALNLAIARIVIVSTLVSKISLTSELSYSGLDKSLISPPIGWSYVAAYIPRSLDLIIIFYGLFVVFGALAIVGLYGRFACLVTSAVGFYLLTLPQLFGKVNHDHNLILFGFILAASPCCDTLAVDAIRDGLSAGRRGILVSARAESTSYADPLKAMMVLMGLIYFFPGAWKLARAGAHWFSANNMRWMMARKLLEAPHITAIQAWAMHHPFLLLSGAAFTPLFEIGFIFAILSRATRPYAAACGLVFHNLTGLLMNISFFSLQACYVILVNWRRVFSWMASRFGIEPITVRCSGSKELRLLNVVSEFDWLNFVSIQMPSTSVSNEMFHGGDVKGLTVIDQTGSRATGYEACVAIMKRLVILWPLYACFSFTALRKLGSSVFAHFPRARESKDVQMINRIERSRSDGEIGVLFRLVSGACVIGMILAGLSHSVNAWPIACYPTFDHLETGQVSELSATAVDDDGRVYRETLSFDPKIGARLAPERYNPIVDALIRQDKPVSKEKAVALVNLWRDEYKYPNFKEVTLYCDTYTFDADGKLGRLVGNQEVAHLDRSDGLIVR